MKDGVSRRGSSDGQEDKGVQLVYKTRAWRITTSHFWRISVATWNGSPSTNSNRNSSTESAPAYCFSASFWIMRTTGAMPSPGISRESLSINSRGVSSRSLQ